jgi:hypothetical protein
MGVGHGDHTGLTALLTQHNFSKANLKSIMFTFTQEPEVETSEIQLPDLLLTSSSVHPKTSSTCHLPGLFSNSIQRHFTYILLLCTLKSQRCETKSRFLKGKNFIFVLSFFLPLLSSVFFSHFQVPLVLSF